MQNMTDGLKLPTFLSSSTQLNDGVGLLGIRLLNSTLSGDLQQLGASSHVRLHAAASGFMVVSEHIPRTRAFSVLSIDASAGVLVEGAGSTAAVAVPDITACQSVVHVIDALLLPQVKLSNELILSLFISFYGILMR